MYSTSLTYRIYYYVFEVFPLVYPPFDGFNLGLISVVFLCVLVTTLIAIILYFSYIRWYLMLDITKNGMRAQQHWLVPALIGLFIFA